MAKWSKATFKEVARVLAAHPLSHGRYTLVRAFVRLFAADNPAFDVRRFARACDLDADMSDTLELLYGKRTRNAGDANVRP